MTTKSKEYLVSIKQRKKNVAGIKANILTRNNTTIDKIIESIALLPPQSYGLLIKEIIFNALHAVESDICDGYSGEHGNYFVKVYVGNSPTLRLKQVSAVDDVSNYICVFVNYETAQVNLYSIPKIVALHSITDAPDHGSLKKGFTSEYTAFIKEMDIQEYMLDLG